jgi:phosphatidylserine decarboxylase
MTVRSAMLRIIQQEDVNFLLTNLIPRQLLTRFMGWFSKIEQPLVRDLSIAAWRLFADLRLEEARKERFTSLHDCFIRELKPGARPTDPDPTVLTSPCDAIVGACGRLDGVQVLQAKGFPYTLYDLFGDPALVHAYRDAAYATLRITSTMYHRFHAPHDCRVEQVTYFSGDTWNVNPVALARVEKLFCRNERAVIRMRLHNGGHPIALVPVAAILVASLRLHFLNLRLHLRYGGPSELPCHALVKKGEELGWFEHGSTIIVLLPSGVRWAEGIQTGQHIKAGKPLALMDPT